MADGVFDLRPDGSVRFVPVLSPTDEDVARLCIAGLVPLVKATGAGAIGSRTIGSSAFGGMLAGTIVGIFLIPGLYYMFGKLARAGRLQDDEDFDPLSEQFVHSQPAYEPEELRAEHEEEGAE